MSKLKCGCQIVYDEKRLRGKIKFCPLHEAAPDLLEACEKALGWLITLNNSVEYKTLPDDIVFVNEAIAKAKGEA